MKLEQVFEFLLVLIIFFPQISIGVKYIDHCPTDNTYIYEDTIFAPNLFCNVEDSLDRPPYKGKQTGVLIIMNNDVTLDCNFMTLNGTGTNGTFEDKFRFGIFADGFSNITIKNCIVQNYGDGILLIHVTNSKVFNNVVRFNENGIVIDNTIPSYYEKHQRSFPLKPSYGGNIINNNTAISNGHSYLLLFSNGNQVFNNYAFNNSFGLELEHSSYNKIYNNLIENDRGIFIQDESNENFIFNNSLLSIPTVDGAIKITNSSKNYIYNNFIYCFRKGIVDNGRDNKIEDNIVRIENRETTQPLLSRFSEEKKISSNLVIFYLLVFCFIIFILKFKKKFFSTD
jgi:parallel beta-helix repeat protein